jgi:hypothetical protein
MRVRILATACARGLQIVRPHKIEGAGKTGCALHPRSHVQCASKQNAHEHTGEAEAVRPSLRNGFTAYIVLSLVNRASCHHRPREALASQELDASIRASGPHAFAVRISVARLATLTRPPQPVPTSVTLANAPLAGRDGHNMQVIWVWGSSDFLTIGNFFVAWIERSEIRDLSLLMRFPGFRFAQPRLRVKTPYSITRARVASKG